ncbi:MAG TPA: histidinol-phosphate transaminase [Thermoanaerobaculia bacterium]
MNAARISRRRFVTVCGGAAGAALLTPRPVGSRAEASLPFGAAPDLVQLNSNESPFGLPPSGLDALSRAGRTGARYPDGEEDQVRNAIARHHGVRPEQVVLGCGSSDILRMAGAAFLGGPRTLLAAETTFEAVLLYAGVMRAPTRKVPMTADFRHDLPAMAAACDDKTGLVYVCNPNNPTGTIVSKEEMGAFLAKVPPSATVLVDEAYHHFASDPRQVNALDFLPQHPNLVVARTFSKIYAMAGLRLGYAVATRANAEALGRQASWNNTNAAALPVARALLEDRTFLSERKKLVEETRGWLCAELDREKRRYIPSQTNFLMIAVGGDVGPVIGAFRDRGILVGRRFPSMPDWLRVSIGTREEMQRFVASLREIAPARSAA